MPGYSLLIVAGLGGLAVALSRIAHRFVPETNAAVAALFGIAFPFILAASGEATNTGETLRVFAQIVVASGAIGVLAGGLDKLRLGARTGMALLPTRAWRSRWPHSCRSSHPSWGRRCHRSSSDRSWSSNCPVR